MANLRFALFSSAIVLVVALLSGAQAATRCDTICLTDPKCSSSGCSVSRCYDTGSCFQYCLSCQNVETCYGTISAGCHYDSNTMLVNSSPSINMIKFPIAIFSLLLGYMAYLLK